MSCKIYQSEIAEATTGGELSGEAHAHIASCRKCLRAYEARVVVKSLVGGLEKIEAPSDFEFHLRARLAASKMATRHTPRRAWFVPSLASIALAACFVLTIAATVFLKRAATTQSVAQTSSSAPALASSVLATDIRRDVVPGSEVSEINGGSPQIVKIKKAGVNNFSQQQTAGLSKAEGKRFAGARRLAASESSDLSLRSANVITEEGAPVRFVHVNNTAPISIQVRSASIEPLRIIWRDEQGNARPVSIKSVSFGAQNTSGLPPQSTITSRTDVEGVW